MYPTFRERFAFASCVAAIAFGLTAIVLFYLGNLGAVVVAGLGALIMAVCSTVATLRGI